MEATRGQGQLFQDQLVSDGCNQQPKIVLSPELLKSWQQRLQGHQGKLFGEKAEANQQACLFETEAGESQPTSAYDTLDPLKLTPLPMSFWRWPISPHHGPAIYLVMDRPTDLDTPLVLYVGETVAADRRWKGEHDCKAYLAAYSEALATAGMTNQLSIRFWMDVPKATRARRQVEQQLIQRWLPPFNKETRARWSTPFTAETK